jgi:hypothetical protein
MQTYTISKSQQFLYTFAHMFRRTLVLMLCLYTMTTNGQEKYTVKHDLHNDWLVYKADKYLPISEQTNSNVNAVYFSIDLSQFGTDILRIKALKPFYFFTNGRLIAKFNPGSKLLSIDSLSRFYGEILNISLYQDEINADNLKTEIISTDTKAGSLSSLKPDGFFKDFVVVAGLSIIVFFVWMIRVHPKLAADYFSVARVLSLREVDDNQSHARLAISSNVLFYIFCSLLLSFYLIIVFYHLPSDYSLPLAFARISFWGVLLQWLKLGTIILFLLFLKMIVVYALSELFGMKGIAGIHFFNWVRLLLIIAGALSLIVFIYLITRGYNTHVYAIMLSMIVVSLGAWVIIVFLKLNNRVEHSMFHLFSYICATEVIPLLVTIKVLFQ